MCAVGLTGSRGSVGGTEVAMAQRVGGNQSGWIGRGVSNSASADIIADVKNVCCFADEAVIISEFVSALVLAGVVLPISAISKQRDADVRYCQIVGTAVHTSSMCRPLQKTPFH